MDKQYTPLQEKLLRIKAESLKTMSGHPELLSAGHRLCAGCPESIVVRHVLHAAQARGRRVVVANATSCLEVATTVYPQTAWRVPWIHCAFENTAAVASGIEAAYRYKKKLGLMNEEITFLVFAGDGGTYDIGLQALSGSFERGTKIVYVCLNNEGYMNTGIQRSGATPFCANTTTTPVGKESTGKVEWRKDIIGIMAAHHAPYIAQATLSVSRPYDLATKASRAFAAEGPAFINVLCPCPRGWRFDARETVAIAQHAVETCSWPLFEIIGGRWFLNYTPKEKRPVAEWLKRQGRFGHLFKPQEQHDILSEIQTRIDHEWEELLRRTAI